MTDSIDWHGDPYDGLAVPRPVGSDTVARIEDAVADRLRSLGFDVIRQRFETGPHRLYAASIAGAGLGWVALLTAPFLSLQVVGWSASLAGLAGVATVAVLCVGIANRRLPFNAPRVEARNIVAIRSANTRAWLVAHSDTKGQPLSLAGRVLAVGALGIGLAGLTACLLARVAGPLPWWAVIPWVLLVMGGGGALSLPPVKGESAGAVDNASGLVAVLSAAEKLRHRTDVGVLVTGAEEMGMEGARAWLTSGGTGELFVNFDGIDNRGAFTMMRHAPPRRRGAELRALQTAIAEALAPDAVRSSPLPLGIFVDGSVLARGGLTGVTVSRGDWSTLRVVHTVRDVAGRTEAGPARRAGEAVAVALDRMLG